jgi:acyl transferase domain-containing protein
MDKTDIQSPPSSGEKHQADRIIHPLLHRNTSTSDELIFTTILNGDEFFLSDHIVKEKRTLPGVAYLEMAKTALEKSGIIQLTGDKNIQLRNVVWAYPITVDKEPLQVNVKVKQENKSDFSFSIYSKAKSDIVEYCQGMAKYDLTEKIGHLDLNTLKKQCNKRRITPKKCYDVFKSKGVEYGPKLSGLEDIFIGNDKILTRLSLPPSIRDTQDKYFLHPCIMDSALQGSVAFLLDSNNTSSALPFALRNLIVIKECPSSAWALVRHSKEQDNRAKANSFDVTIFDNNGDICVEIEGLIAQESMNKKETLSDVLQSGFDEELIKVTSPLSGRIDLAESRQSILENIERDLKAHISELAEIPEEEVDVDENLLNYGFDSFQLAKLASILTKYYDIVITPSIFFGYTTIKELSRFYLDEYEDVLKDFYRGNDTSQLTIKEKYGSVSSLKSEERMSKSHKENVETDNLLRRVNNSEKNSQNILENIERDLKAHISELAEIPEEEVDVDENLLNYGFDSFQLAKLASTLTKYYDIVITPSIFFGYTTIKELSRFYLDEYEDDLKGFYQQDEASILISGEKQGSILSIKSYEYENGLKDKDRDGKWNNESIVIVGMSGRFPMANDLDEFWQNLLKGKDCIQEIPKERWDWREYYGDPKKEVYKTDVKWGGFISGIDEFDPDFFNISPEDATLMDPQQRLMMIYVWKAIEDAGYSAKSLSGSQTGVFIGTSSYEYTCLLSKLNNMNRASSGVFSSMGPNRISYFLNLNGPSEPIDTTCSSSLVAIHRAIESMNNGSCEMAIAGGINTILTPDVYINNAKTGMLSKDGRCKTFSENADGYVRGEGIGIIILKKMSEAVKAKDHIYGVIRSTVENHNGRSVFFSSLNLKAQIALLLSAYIKAGIDPRSVGYIETHGTGTRLGDPLEIDGLKRAFRELYMATGDPDVYDVHCGLGSVKSNIGHLEVASGMAGIIKVLLQIKHKTFVKNLHSENISSFIKLNDSPFYIVQENRRWESFKDSMGNIIPRRAGVSSFGVGGTNAHVVIEEYIPEKEDQPVTITSSAQTIIIFSAKNEKRLKEQVQLLLEWIKNNKPTEEDLIKISYTLQVGREAMEERMALTVVSINDLEDKLKKYLKNEKNINGLFRRNIKNNPNILSDFNDDEDIENRVNEWINNNNYKMILRLWVNGFELDWDRIYKSERPYKISLPTYPFARENYWISKKEEYRSEENSEKQIQKGKKIDSIHKPDIRINDEMEEVVL